MSQKEVVSMYINTARKELKQAHKRTDRTPEDMDLTWDAVDSLGIQHYARHGETLPARILRTQAEAMAALVHSYSEMAYESSDEEILDHGDESVKASFDDHLDAAHDAAVTAEREAENLTQDND